MHSLVCASGEARLSGAVGFVGDLSVPNCRTKPVTSKVRGSECERLVFRRGGHLIVVLMASP